jgi:hypothetical protein
LTVLLLKALDKNDSGIKINIKTTVRITLFIIDPIRAVSFSHSTQIFSAGFLNNNPVTPNIRADNNHHGFLVSQYTTPSIIINASIVSNTLLLFISLK